MIRLPPECKPKLGSLLVHDWYGFAMFGEVKIAVEFRIQAGLKPYLAAVPSWLAMSLRLLGHWSKSADLELGMLAGVMPGSRVAVGWA
jgi:hypothetical protein